MDAALAADEVDRHDVRVMQLGGRLRLVLEALQLPGVERGGERQHLQGHAPAERELLGLVDDAHAAPADLADDAEVAELHREIREGFGWSSHGTGQRGPQGRCDAFDLLSKGEELGQLGGKGGMPSLVLVLFRSRARLGGFQIGRQNGVEFPLMRGSMNRFDWHGSGLAFCASCSRNRRSPRNMSPAAASLLRPRLSPTSASVMPLRWCSSTAWRWSSGSPARASARRSRCSLCMAC